MNLQKQRALWAANQTGGGVCGGGGGGGGEQLKLANLVALRGGRREREWEGGGGFELFPWLVRFEFEKATGFLGRKGNFAC